MLSFFPIRLYIDYTNKDFSDANISVISILFIIALMICSNTK